MPQEGVYVGNNLNVGDQLIYTPGGNRLMEIAEIMSPLNLYNRIHTVKLVDVEEYARNNRQMENTQFIYVYMEDAITLPRKLRKRPRLPNLRRLRFN